MGSGFGDFQHHRHRRGDRDGDLSRHSGKTQHTGDVFANIPVRDPEDEYLQFAYLGISLFRRYENAYFQYQTGMINDDFWFGHRDNLLWFFHRPGTQKWWRERRLGFAKSFREFLESTSPDDVTSPEIRLV